MKERMIEMKSGCGNVLQTVSIYLPVRSDCGLAIYFQIHPKNLLGAVEEEKEKDFFRERTSFYPSVER